MLSTTTAILAILAATAHAKEGRTHGVGYFWSGPTVEARMDPIISPGAPQSQHVHTVMGGNGFSVSMNENDAVNSKCTGSNVVGDKSNYWFPKLFFQDPKTKKFEGVDLVQLKAYYFMEGTDDVIKPFPAGFQMVVGDPFLRSNPYKTPWADHTSYDRDAEIQPISWSCGRNDGKLAYPQGLVDRAGGSTQGPGFPNIKCDGAGSPLASYIHFPSCADLNQPFHNFRNNTAWPTIKYSANGAQKQNCPTGYTHLPHLFLEIHWDAMKFANRWTEGVDRQPFVLANGDNTGFGGHADFIAGWDENVLSYLINTCDSGGHGDGLDSCSGVQNFNTGGSANSPPNIHPQSCKVQPPVPEVITGALDKLPGCNPIQAGPRRASTCDCSSGTPVCNGNVVVVPVKPSSSKTTTPPVATHSTVKSPSSKTTPAVPHPTAKSSSKSTPAASTSKAVGSSRGAGASRTTTSVHAHPTTTTTTIKPKPKTTTTKVAPKSTAKAPSKGNAQYDDSHDDDGDENYCDIPLPTTTTSSPPKVKPTTAPMSGSRVQRGITHRGFHQGRAESLAQAQVQS